jgi:hypothetical protein
LEHNGFRKVLREAAASPLCSGHSISTPQDGGSRFMTVASLSQDLYRFAIELRQLAYTMPAGQEDPLIHLSERMVHHAQHEAAEGEL